MKKSYFFIFCGIVLALLLRGVISEKAGQLKPLEKTINEPTDLHSTLEGEDLGEGAIVYPPKMLEGLGGFAFSYPSMEPTGWPGIIGLANRKESPSSTSFKEEFPVYVGRLWYEPETLEEMPYKSVPRPQQMLSGRGGGLHVFPSNYNGLDAFAFVDPSELSASQKLGSYIESADVPYDIMIDCTSVVCDAEIHSERSAMRYRLMIPAEGIGKFYDVIKATDEMVVSWSRPGGKIYSYYENHKNIKSSPIVKFLDPQSCKNPGYVKAGEYTNIKSPNAIAVDKDNNIYVGDSCFIPPNNLSCSKIYKIDASHALNKNTNVNIFASNLDAFHDISFDDSDHIYISTHLGVMRSKLKGWLKGIFFKAGAHLEDPDSIAVTGDGGIYAIAYQAGSLLYSPPQSNFYQPAERIDIHFQRSDGLVLGRGGDIYLSDSYLGKMYKIAPGENASIYASNIKNPTRMAYGNEYIYVITHGKSSILKLGSNEEACAVTDDFHDYSDITLDQSGNIFVTSMLDNKIVEYSPSK